MKFIHLSDAHLDSPFLGLSFLPSNRFNQIKQSTEISFQNSVDTAIKENVDLFLIAGDTFDSIHPSLKSQIFLNNQIKRLVSHQIQVVMILGNHDYINPEELLLVQSPYFKLLGANQSVESVNYETKDGFEYVVHGFSYRQNHIEKDIAAEFPEKVSLKYNIGLMHAGEKASGSQNVYAPFSLKELKELNYDYFALGHIHHRQTLSEDPLIAYSGNIQGRHINELGPKGVNVVEVDESTGKSKLRFIATSPLQWKMIDYEIIQKISLSDLTRTIVKEINSVNKETTIFGINIMGSSFLSENELEFLQDNQSLGQISQELTNDSILAKIYLRADKELSLNASDQNSFDEAKDLVLTKESIESLGQDLSKKKNWIREMIDDDSFIGDVKELAQVKLGQKLKDFNDEAH